ncbi:MAG: response regulator transcription factor [Bacteroidia bacterium]
MINSEKEGSDIMKILLVDDDAMITELLSARLVETGHCVECAGNGWEAITKLSHNEYDLLITDLMIPDISGLTLLSLLQSYLIGKVPVIIISSLDQPSTVLSGMGLGADDYFVKPINIQKLTTRINMLDTQHGQA